MDDLTRVREWEADVPPLTDEARSAARVRLQSAISRENHATRSVAPSRRLVFRMAAAAAVAAVGGTVVVASTNRDGNAVPRTSLTAAQVLNKAADRSRSDSARLPIPRNDQYFYTRTYSTQTPLKGGRAKTWTDESWLSVDGSRPSRRQEHGKVHHDPPLGKHEVAWPPTTYAKLQTMPTDPDKLLNLFRVGRKRSPMTDTMAFDQACLLMMGPRVMPPGLQAGALEALAKIPGVKLDHDQVDGIGRPGIAVSYPNSTFTFVFDRKTYAYLGLRTKGIGLERVNGKWQNTDRYFEMRSLERMAVVDHIGQRPQG
ncbi:CU044_5270 family protein [Streptomyces fagopyri]|uniref:CU044_5270 family protein n=1 Tax=Streptomyces fagopyri TaxID=2662397 RepID=UPI003719F0ED